MTYRHININYYTRINNNQYETADACAETSHNSH